MNNPTISFQENLYQNVEQLNLEIVIDYMKEGLGNIRENINLIRSNLEDKKQVQELKKKLPAFSFNIFSDSRRTNDTFIKTDHLLFDIDKINSEQIKELRDKIKSDGRTYLLFTSPSGKGLKIAYRLDDSITSTLEYYKNYHHYSNYFSEFYNVKLDKSTKDPARICFLSYDPEIYYNANAVSISGVDSSEYFPNELTLYNQEIETNFDNVEEGERHNKLKFLVLGLMQNGESEDNAIRSLNNWNSRNNPPEDESEIDFQVRDLYKRYSNFWYKENEKVKIGNPSLINFLQHQGFCKYYLNNIQVTYLRIKDKKIQEFSNHQIRDFVKEHINQTIKDSRLRFNVNARIINGARNYFSETNLNSLTAVGLSLNSDTRDSSFFYFNNCFIKVNGDSISTFEYSKLENPIWSESIRDRQFANTDEISVFEKFIKNAMQDNFRVESLKSAIGYLLHTHKDRALAKAIVFVDENISDELNGRTGKSLVGQALSKIRKTVRLNGKKINFENRFLYQRVTLDTDIIEFNDVRDNFNFEGTFSDITEDLQIECKGKTEFSIPFDTSPKLLISSNSVVKGQGDSFDARKFEIEFSNHYNLLNTPKDEFNHTFFDDWDDSEWNRFYNFMIRCVQLYLKNGLIPYKKKKLEDNTLKSETNEDFFNFAKRIRVNEEYIKNNLFNDFKRDFPDYAELSQHMFTRYLKIFARIRRLDVKERESNSLSYIKFVNKVN